MNIEAIPDILATVKNVKWRWSKEEMEECIRSLGWKFIEQVLHRQEYLVCGNLQASIYFDGSECIVIEIDVEVFLDPDTLSLTEYDDKVDEFFAKYEQAVQLAEKVLGRPRFNDGAAARGYPEDQDAVWVALWHFPACRIMIQQKHEDRELPFRVSLVIAPPMK